MKKPKNKVSENTQKNSIHDPELDEIAAIIEAWYWLPLLKTPFETLDEICNEVDEDCKYLSAPVKSFSTNLRAAEKVLLLPYLLVAPQVTADPRGNQFLAEIVKSRKLENITTDHKPEIEFVKIALSVSGEIFSRKKTELNYLMYQACISIWSAFETFCKDVFILSLNQRPELYFNLQQSSELKERFSTSNVSWQKLLEQHKFNFNGKLGTIIGSNKDFSSPKLLQEVFCCLFSEGVPAPPEILALLKNFKGKELWKLGQRRHLIAHRCGIVDQEYIDKTKDLDQIIGQPLSLKGRDIAAGMGAVTQCAIGLYATARNCWERPDE